MRGYLNQKEGLSDSATEIAPRSVMLKISGEEKSGKSWRRSAWLRGMRDDWKNGGLRNLVIELYGGCCAWCQKTGRLELDHIIPLYNLGTNSPGNLQLLCYRCHKCKTQFDRFKFGQKKKPSKAETYYIKLRKFQLGYTDKLPKPEW